MNCNLLVFLHQTKMVSGTVPIAGLVVTCEGLEPLPLVTPFRGARHLENEGQGQK